MISGEMLPCFILFWRSVREAENTTGEGGCVGRSPICSQPSSSTVSETMTVAQRSRRSSPLKRPENLDSKRKRANDGPTSFGFWTLSLAFRSPIDFLAVMSVVAGDGGSCWGDSKPSLAFFHLWRVSQSCSGIIPRRKVAGLV